MRLKSFEVICFLKNRVTFTLTYDVPKHHSNIVSFFIYASRSVYKTILDRKVDTCNSKHCLNIRFDSHYHSYHSSFRRVCKGGAKKTYHC